MNTPLPPPTGGGFLVSTPPFETVLTPEKLDAEARLMADAARNFMRGDVLSVADRLQTQEPGLMPSLLRKAGALGLLSLEVPEGYGGLELSKSVSARIAEEAAVEPSFAVSHNVHTSVATLPLVFFGTDQQKSRYLPRLATGELLGAYALSEAHAGSDALALRTRAVPTADGRSYTLTGEKMWITNAGFADLFVVFAVVEGQKGLTAFLVERGFPGVSIGREEHKLGLKGSSTCRLLLENVPVPAENVLGTPGEGAKIALNTLNLGRFKIAASSLGQGKNLLGIAARYARERIAFGKPIAEFGLVRQKLTTMATRLFTCESMLYRVAGNLDSVFQNAAPNPPPSPQALHPSEEYAVECALLKVACTEALDFCADECLQIHGGYGYTEEFPAARAWRDARVNRIYEGTNEINRLNIVQLLLRRIEKGRLEYTEPASDHDMGPPSANDLRWLLFHAFTAARTKYSRLAEEQEICGALADNIIDLFAYDSLGARLRGLMEVDPEKRGMWAWDAQTHFLNHRLGRFSDNLLAILLTSEAKISEELQIGLRQLLIRSASPFARPLGQAVVDAEGYPWR